MYDPNTGRFFSRDPLGGSIGQPQGLNPYAYAGNNPVAIMDPSGMAIIDGSYQQTALVGFAGASSGGAGGNLSNPCSDPQNLLHWFCGDNIVRLAPFGVVRMNPFDRDFLNGLSGALGADETRYSGEGSATGAGSGTSHYVDLYRAVSQEESEDIINTGAFRGKLGEYEGKLFATTVEDAEWFGETLYPQKDYRIVRATIPEEFANRLFRAPMDRRLSFAVNPDELAEFNRFVRIGVVK